MVMKYMFPGLLLRAYCADISKPRLVEEIVWAAGLDREGIQVLTFGQEEVEGPGSHRSWCVMGLTTPKRVPKSWG